MNEVKDFEVEATYDINKATQFFIVRCDEEDNHFHIVYDTPMTFKRRSGSRQKFITKVGDPDHRPTIHRYLCADVNWRGRSKRNKPLRMNLDGQSTNSRLAIYCRKSSFHHPADLTEWVNEKEIFFINCQEQSLTTPVSSYLCVYASGRTGCKPTVRSHDEKNKFMLFRLLTPANEARTPTSTANKGIVPYYSSDMTPSPIMHFKCKKLMSVLLYGDTGRFDTY